MPSYHDHIYENDERHWLAGDPLRSYVDGLDDPLDLVKHPGCTWQLDARGRLWLLGFEARQWFREEVVGLEGWFGRTTSFDAHGRLGMPGFVRLPLPDSLADARLSSMRQWLTFDRGRIVLGIIQDDFDAWQRRPSIGLVLKPYGVGATHPAQRTDVPSQLRFPDATILDAERWASLELGLDLHRVRNAKDAAVTRPNWLPMRVEGPLGPDDHMLLLAVCYVQIEDGPGQIPLNSGRVTRRAIRRVEESVLFPGRSLPMVAHWFTGEIRMPQLRGCPGSLRRPRNHPSIRPCRSSRGSSISVSTSAPRITSDMRRCGRR